MAYNILSGAVKNTSTPCFLASLTTTVTNVTGDGTTYTFIPDTLVYDQGSNFNISTGVFTAPITGKYQFTCFMELNGLTSSYNDVRINAVSTLRTYRMLRINPSSIIVGNLLLSGNTIQVDMNSTNTISFTLLVAGSTKSVGLLGEATNCDSAISGHFIC